jgi:hypothetical protein
MQWKGIRFYRVNAESSSDDNFTKLAVNVDISDLKVNGDGLRIDFSYAVDYQPGIAKLKFDGYALLGGTRAELDSAQNGWKKDRSLPRDIAEPLVNIIKFSAETNGVLVAKALNMVPPLLAPKIDLKSEE